MKKSLGIMITFLIVFSISTKISKKNNFSPVSLYQKISNTGNSAFDECPVYFNAVIFCRYNHTFKNTNICYSEYFQKMKDNYNCAPRISNYFEKINNKVMLYLQTNDIDLKNELIKSILSKLLYVIKNCEETPTELKSKFIQFFQKSDSLEWSNQVDYMISYLDKINKNEIVSEDVDKYSSLKNCPQVKIISEKVDSMLSLELTEIIKLNPEPVFRNKFKEANLVQDNTFNEDLANLLQHEEYSNMSKEKKLEISVKNGENKSENVSQKYTKSIAGPDNNPVYNAIESNNTKSLENENDNKENNGMKLKQTNTIYTVGSETKPIYNAKQTDLKNENKSEKIKSNEKSSNKLNKSSNQLDSKKKHKKFKKNRKSMQNDVYQDVNKRIFEINENVEIEHSKLDDHENKSIFSLSE